TNREIQIIENVAEGRNSQEIAQTLYISVRTVETHRKNIKSKLGFKNFYSVLSYAFRNHILQL
ncbi:MAG: response regulator transcription factor, partial [Chitinophagales bacterium]